MNKLGKIKVVLIDLSGTIHVDNHAIQGIFYFDLVLI